MDLNTSKNERLENIKEFYTLNDIKFKYPRRLLIETLEKHIKKYVYFTPFVEYYSEFLSIEDNNIIEFLLVHTIWKNTRYEIGAIEKKGFKIIRHREILITTHNNIADIHPLIYRKKFFQNQ